MFLKWISGASVVNLFACEDFKGQLEALIEFLSPLLYEAARGYNQTPLQITSHK